ncbi:MacS family sensor histidine kinase [Longispora albida]|uniref:MacS family sensor histidine kinase n=1 Tax=Longispora albida TaxID=203523 RepID=UPI00035D26B9|nr:DUF5931 domain-containing protein [Longispora albida]
MGLEAPLWRALAVFRFAALAYPPAILVLNRDRLSYPVVAWLTLAAMAAWSAWSSYLYSSPARRGWPQLAADLVATSAAIVFMAHASASVDPAYPVPVLPGPWIGSVVLAWAISGGRTRGAIAALILGAVDFAARGGLSPSVVSGIVLMLLAGTVVGHVTRLAVRAEQQLQQAAELAAATRERERLARDIHDSVLQVLALVQRRGAEIGGEAAELGRLAGEQESALRALVGAATMQPPEPGGDADLRGLLAGYEAPGVTVAGPATPVPLPHGVAAQVAAAVGAALDNVGRHCPPGTKSWLLIEDTGAEVLVSIRDDGPGMATGRLAEAEHAGRLGMAQSIRGRIRDLGGEVTVDSAPGHGTEVELRIPRATTLGT